MKEPNPTHVLVRPGAVCTPASDALPDPDSVPFEEWTAAYNRLTVVDESIPAKRLKRVPVADPREGHLYYGNGSEPCHYCEQKPGKPHVHGCDHEVCPGCASQGRIGVQIIGCDVCQIAEHDVILRGRIGGRTVTVFGLGFTEDEAQADADAQWDKRLVSARKRWLAKTEKMVADLYERLEREEKVGSPLVGRIERTIADSEANIAKVRRELGGVSA